MNMSGELPTNVAEEVRANRRSGAFDVFIAFHRLDKVPVDGAAQGSFVQILHR
jgi:hypothetical protein